MTNPPPALRYGMLGGGPGAMVGQIHRTALALDGSARLTAGCFSANPETSREFGLGLGLDPERLYPDYETMARMEAARPDPIDFVIIATPNNTHYPMAKAFLEQGIHVVCDKPLTVDAAQARELADLAREKDLLFAVTYTYMGYPMVKQARNMVRDGLLGEVRFVKADYAQDWMAVKVEDTGHKQAAWRADPARGGKVGSLGDIGVHVEYLAGYVSGLRLSRLLARLDTLMPGRRMDDTGSIMVEYKGGAKGLYWCSQAAPGHANDLRIYIYGEKGGLKWRQEEPDTLLYTRVGGGTEILTRGRTPLSAGAEPFVRLPSGHPEGFYESFANIYKAFCAALNHRLSGLGPDPKDLVALDFPTVQNGLDGMRFIEACVKSSGQGGVWVDLED